ncbi:hypothetical protein JCM11491_004795 [Sporobolomyces phaffii]
MQSGSRLVRSTLARTSSRPAAAATPLAFPPSSASSWPRAAASLGFPVSNVRTFTCSPASWAREAGSGNPFEDGPTQFQQEHAPLFERVMQHPEVMESIRNMAELTQKKTGVNLQAGDKPSLSMMYTLARDPELRQAAERLMHALKAAGIEIDPKEAFKALQMMGGEGFPGAAGASSDLNALHRAVNKGSNGGRDDGGDEGQGGGDKK